MPVSAKRRKPHPFKSRRRVTPLITQKKTNPLRIMTPPVPSHFQARMHPINIVTIATIRRVSRRIRVEGLGKPSPIANAATKITSKAPKILAVQLLARINRLFV